MAVIARTNVIRGAGLGSPLPTSGAPTAGTNAVQTLTFGGTITGGTFTLSLDGQRTAPIARSATNTTLVSNTDAAIEALPNVGTGGVTVAVGTMTAGIGTLTVTFNGSQTGLLLVATLVADGTLLTGTAPTLAVTNTTPGVTASHRSAPTGSLLTDVTNGKLYQNTSTSAGLPTWTVAGTES